MLEKNLTLLYVGEKNLSPEAREKNSYPNQITHTLLPLKSQVVDP